MRERMDWWDWWVNRILPADFPPHSQPSFPEPLAINDLQKQGWIWVPRKVPKSRASYHNLLITKGPVKDVLAVGWKTRPAPETGTGTKRERWKDAAPGGRECVRMAGSEREGRT